MNKKISIQKLAIAGVLIALAVALSGIYIPIGASKCFPIQHLVNVIAGTILGPWYAVAMAFITSLIRVMIEGRHFDVINDMAVKIADKIRERCPSE